MPTNVIGQNYTWSGDRAFVVLNVLKKERALHISGSKRCRLRQSLETAEGVSQHFLEKENRQ